MKISFSIYEKAAENGLPLAMHALGFMYFEGKCHEKNPKLCIEWFERAAGEGMMGSATTLGMIYEEGKIVDQDLEKAESGIKRQVSLNNLHEIFSILLTVKQITMFINWWRFCSRKEVRSSLKANADITIVSLRLHRLYFGLS